MRAIDLDNINFEHYDTIVYFSSPDMLIRRNGSLVEIELNDRIVQVNDIRILELSNFKIDKWNENVLIAFGGRTSFLVRPDGTYDSFNLKSRHIVTNLSIHENVLIFGSTLGSLFHFVIYNLEDRKRIFQTQSIEARTLSHIVTNDSIYALMGNSQLIAYDHEGREKWKRFEHQYVIPGLAYYKGRLLYCSNNQIKITDGKKIESINIPIVKFDKIEGIIGDNLYAICGNKKNICCFNLHQRKLVYEIRGSQKIDIRKLLLTKGKIENSQNIVNCLFFSDDSHLRIADLKNGIVRFQVGVSKIKEIVQKDEVIVRTHFGKSHVLRQKKHEESIVEI